MNSINKTINTVFERERVLKFLDQFDQIIFDSGIDVKSWSQENAPIELPLDTLDPEELFSKSKLLRKEIMSLAIIGISVVEELDESFVKKITTWINENTDKKVLLDIRYDKALIGGAVVESGGYISENSFRGYFERRSNGF